MTKTKKAENGYKLIAELVDDNRAKIMFSRLSGNHGPRYYGKARAHHRVEYIGVEYKAEFHIISYLEEEASHWLASHKLEVFSVEKVPLVAEAEGLFEVKRAVRKLLDELLNKNPEDMPIRERSVLEFFLSQL